jgi:hypothetical protein
VYDEVERLERSPCGLQSEGGLKERTERCEKEKERKRYWKKGRKRGKETMAM